MKTSMKLLTLVLCLCLCLGMAACGSTGGNAPSNTGAPAGTPAPGTQPAEVGKKVLNIASIGEIDNAYPIQMTPEEYMFMRIYADTLVTYENGEIVPMLAESWELTDGGCTLTFHLRGGIKFHDGEDFNSEAVKANILDMQNSPASYSLPAVGTVTEIECPDAVTIVLHYDNPYYGLVTDFCWTDAMIMVSPKQIAAKNAGEEVKPIGTGPYAFAEYVKGGYTRFVRNESYWNGAPYYDEIVVKYIPDATSRMQALKNGEIDLIYGATEVSYDQYVQLSSTAGMAGKMSPVQARNRNLTLNFNGILADTAIREAIALSIDKNAISEGMSYGYEAVADTVLTPGSLYEDECPKISYSYDPEKAAKVLESAGWVDSNGDGIREKDGKTLTFTIVIPAENIENANIALLLQDMFGEVGMRMEIKTLENADWFQSFYDPNGFDLTIQNTYYDYASPTQWFGAIEYMAQATSVALLEDSETFLSMIREFKIIDDDARLAEIFKYLVQQDQEQFLDIPLTGMMEPIVYNTARIADYNYGGCHQFFNPLWVIPVK